MEFVYFLGRFHVLVLHLPIGILLSAIGLELIAWRRQDRALISASAILWGFGAASAIITVVLGWMHSLEGGFDGATVVKHQWFGVGVAVIATGIWLARLKFKKVPGKQAAMAATSIVLMLLITGHYGGNITHGETYLVEYAPGPLRALAGLSEEDTPRIPVKSLASADVYLDLVAPILKARCRSCHNNSKRRGSLSVSSYDALTVGGDSGPALTPGNLVQSELYRRVVLPADHREFMPQDGKTPLNEHEVKAIEWWILSGAPRNGQLGQFEISAEIRPVLASVLGVEATENGMLADVGRADPRAIKTLRNLGFLVRPFTQDSSFLEADFSVAQRDILTEDIEAIAAVSKQLVSLNLRGANLTDKAAATFPELPNMHYLNVAENPLSDESIVHLTKYKRLKTLVIHTTRISDKSLPSILDTLQLANIYVWCTNITHKTVAALHHQGGNVNLNVNFGVGSPSSCKKRSS